MNFLFDLINDISGYTSKYYDEVAEKIDHEGLIIKYREENKKYVGKNNLNESKLLGDKYPHSLMVIESVHELYRMHSPQVD